jgi:hypothetical protein
MGPLASKCANVDLDQPAVAGREQGGIPSEQPILCQCGIAACCHVQNHVDYAFNMAIRRRERTDIDAKTTRNGRTNGRRIESLAFDLTGLDDVFCQCRQTGLLAQRHANVGQAAEQQTLGTADSANGPAREARS